MYLVYEHDTSFKKDDKPVARFFNEQMASDFAKELQSKFPKESPISVGVLKERD